MQIGQVAPHFELYNTNREKVELKNLLGKKIVLLFFPAAWTSVCTSEMCALRDDIDSYNALNATVYGVSVDMPFALKKFKADQNISFDLLSDFNKEVIRAYEIFREEFVLGLRGVAERAVFVIGSDGTIKYKQVLENPGILPDFDALKRALEIIE